VRVFRSIQGSVWATSVITLIAGTELYFANTSDNSQPIWSRPWCYFLVALTIVVAVYLIRLMGMTSANLERLAILIILAWCFESILRYLAKSGEGWAAIQRLAIRAIRKRAVMASLRSVSHMADYGLSSQMQQPVCAEDQAQCEQRDENFADCAHGEWLPSLLAQFAQVGAKADTSEGKQKRPAREVGDAGQLRLGEEPMRALRIE
jgi:hypothetical protein